ncbi:hypothetical protein CFC21_075297 [Triticum aestivum]|uniref:NB-ARC domain-containing protein n=2 Tax=Triticum aestivum TaxID=4565 RepID=A0A9R1HPP4_WHEAT|nr:hypothetical protein CFC21_075297 [Triticum aestivum]
MSDCSALEKLPDKFGSLPKLSFLNLSSCSNLTKLPDNISFPCLEHLNLSICHELEKLPIDIGHLPKLEFMDLSGCYKVSILPGSFCQLNHLKYLDLSDCHNLKELPESFGHLSKLEDLNLTSCAKLRQLPESLCKLFKLRCLYLSYCLMLRELPSSFGDLNLQILRMNGLLHMKDFPDNIGDMTSLTQFVVDKGWPIYKRLNFVGIVKHRVHEIESRGRSSMVDLVGLNCSELILEGLQNVKNPEDADRVKLRDKSNIRVLQLHWENKGGKSVLDRLVPPRGLEIICLFGYTSKDFPNWMLNISSYLPFLSELVLVSLEACDCLPPFGALPNLRSLYLKHIPNIRIVGKEFYGEGRPCMKLRALGLRNMENLEEWWTTESSKENKEFLIPGLHHLEVDDCPKLKFLPYPPRSMHWGLSNSETVWPERGFGMLSSSIDPSRMTVAFCSFSQDMWDRLQHFPTLEMFKVESVSGLRTLPEVMTCFTSLQDFHIQDCPNLTSLPESMKNLAALKTLSLIQCKGLEILPEWLGQLTSLEEIEITDCPNLTCLPESMKHLDALKKLLLVKCNGLEILPGWIGQLTSLEEIIIDDCPNLTCLPESMKNLTALTKLW